MLKQPTHIGRYELISLLSVGGMAEVYLACVSGPGGFRKFVVVKRILQDLRDDEQFVEMFKSEARISASLSHSNIAQVFDFGEDKDNLYLAMEFIQGVDLLKAVRSGIRRGETLPMGLTIRVVRDLCLGLNYAHTYTDAFGELRPVIHRDVNPRNVMLSHSGTVKIIDFGIAKVAGAVTRTSEGTVRGSAGYMSPEQVQGHPLDGRSDQFNVGVLLHEMLVGARLYPGPESAESIRRLLAELPPAPHTLVPAVPQDLSDLTMRALATDPKDRFASCYELGIALEQCSVRMFDEQAVGLWVRERFPEMLERTRALLESLDVKDPDAVRVLAGGLRADVTDERNRTPVGRHLPSEQAIETSTMTIDASEGATVLAVNDSRVGQTVVKETLVAEGFKVLSCGSGPEALEMLSEVRPDLILTDVRLSTLNGFELCAAIRARPDLQTVPVLFLSASCSVEERAHGLEVGGDDFVRKPFVPADLTARVRAHIRRVSLIGKHTAPPGADPGAPH